MAFKRTIPLREFFDFPPSDLMRPRYFRSADARIRMENSLLFMDINFSLDEIQERDMEVAAQPGRDDISVCT